jgi:hypothetical protein
MEDDMLKALFALSMAGTLLVPHVTPALGYERPVGLEATKQDHSQPAKWETLPLPAIPYLDTMPWLFSEQPKRPKVDIWMNPQLQNVGPLLAAPTIFRSYFVLNTKTVDQPN